jgi:hypothetical protein
MKNRALFFPFLEKVLNSPREKEGFPKEFNFGEGVKIMQG